MCRLIYDHRNKQQAVPSFSELYGCVSEARICREFCNLVGLPLFLFRLFLRMFRPGYQIQTRRHVPKSRPDRSFGYLQVRLLGQICHGVQKKRYAYINYSSLIGIVNKNSPFRREENGYGCA